MALVPIISQTWDTTSVFNPTRMNNIEQNLAIVSDATGVKYSNGVSVKDKIDEIGLVDNVKYLRGMISPTTGGNIKEYIVNALASVVTDNKLTKFDIIIARGGYHTFQGYIYADKNYGAGIYSDTGGDLVMWRRVSNTDYFYNISKTQI